MLKVNSSRQPIVPVLMYHSIADNTFNAPHGHLSTPIQIFDAMMFYLRRHKFNSITLDDLHQYLSAAEPLPPNPIVITFDDGYLDNWMNAFPILKKYGMKATIFVIPEFVDPQTGLRPTRCDAWHGKVAATEHSDWGFLSWDELKEMADSGLVNIQSHTLTHTYYFHGSELIDFHHPGGPYVWLAWNKRLERKHRWLTESQEDFVAFGTPIYTYGRALATPQYFADTGLTNVLVEYVQQHGGRAFFGRSDWRKSLQNIAVDYRQRSHACGRYESLQEYETRVRTELRVSKELIERKIGKPVNFVCWPGGACNETTQRIAEEVGYLATTKGSTKNTWGADPRRIHRISGSMSLQKLHPFLNQYCRVWFFAVTVNAYRGDPFYTTLHHTAMKTGRVLRRITSAC